MLLSGPPGLGKTTLSMIIAAELGTNLRITSGPAIQHAGDLAAVLTSLEEGDVLFVDEVHRVARPAEELLYVAMEDFPRERRRRQGPGATAIPLDLPPFTLVGPPPAPACCPHRCATVRLHTAHLDFYSAEELQRVLQPLLGAASACPSPPRGPRVARRSRAAPRIANRLLRRVRDWTLVRGPRAGGAAADPSGWVVDEAAARAALEVYEVDPLGLDRIDRPCCAPCAAPSAAVPSACRRSPWRWARRARPWRPSSSPFLVREGLIGRTPRGAWPPRRPGATWGWSPRCTAPGGAAAVPGAPAAAPGRSGAVRRSPEPPASGR